MTTPQTQRFLVTVKRMCSCDEASETVVACSVVSAEDDLPNISLTKLAELTAEALDGAPLTNVRPMTVDEISAWREAEDDELHVAASWAEFSCEN